MTEQITPIREVLYEHLKKECSTIPDWYQPFFNWEDAAEVLGVRDLSEISKPYGVIVLGEEVGSGSSVGFFQPVEVWPYFTPGNFIPLDVAIAEIIQLLNKKLLEVTIEESTEGETVETTKRYIMQYTGTGRDFHDDDLGAITKRIDFRLPKVR